MTEITGRQYMLSAIKRRYLDRIPTTLLVGPYFARTTDYTVKEILTDAAKSAKAHMTFFEKYQPDSMVVYNDIYLEADALGCEMEFPEDNIAYVKKPKLTEKSQLAKLKIPDPKKDGRIPYFFELVERITSSVGKAGTVGLGHSGPWNIATHLRGIEQLMVDDAMDDPDFVHELMRFATEVVKSIGDTLIDAGYSPSMGEAASSCSIISPKIYREFIKPYHKELYEYFSAKRASVSIHICGFIDPIMADVKETGIKFISLDAPSSLEKMLKVSGGEMTIMGNVPTGLFAAGSPEDMEAAIRSCIETAAGEQGYILCSGCEIPLTATEDRIRHYFDYAHQYGKEFLSKNQ